MTLKKKEIQVILKYFQWIFKRKHVHWEVPFDLNLITTNEAVSIIFNTMKNALHCDRLCVYGGSTMQVPVGVEDVSATTILVSSLSSASYRIFGAFYQGTSS